LPIREENLSGSWRHVDGSVVAYFTLNSDQTFDGRLEDNGVISWKYVGIWSFDENSIHYLYKHSSLEMVKPGTEDYDEVLEIACGQVKVKNMMGQIGYYQR
jgi:hypothetical protein